jgi:hypothetical protein
MFGPPDQTLIAFLSARVGCPYGPGVDVVRDDSNGDPPGEEKEASAEHE